MPRIVFENMAKYGIVRDRLAHSLPLEAWSDGANVRFYEDAVQRVQGYTALWTPGADPWFLQYIYTAAHQFWLHANGTAVRVIDETGNEANISRVVGGAYAANFNVGWNGGMIQGIPVLNNGVDVPQMWNPQTAATPLVALSNWPAGYLARVIRPLKEFLVAVDITKAGTNYPLNILWSHPAAPGSVPVSWDVTDTTRDAGEQALSGSNEPILDLLPLRDVGIIYKADQTHVMQYVGGGAVFSIRRLDEFSGIFSRNCVSPFRLKGPRHFVVTKDDVIIHDGQTSDSVIDGRMRRWLFSQIDGTYYQRLHTAWYSQKNELWVLIPGSSGTINKAAVWNYTENKWSIRDMALPYWVASGLVREDLAADAIWSGDSAAWDTDQSPWDSNGAPRPNSLVMGVPGTSRKIYQLDRTEQNAGTNFTAFVERLGLAVVAQDKEGNPKYDLEMVKLCTEIWPRVTATRGSTIKIYVASQDSIDSDPTWNGPYNFVVGTDRKVNPLVSGRLLGVRFEFTGIMTAILFGFDMVVEPVGAY